jgi:4'-phosphopantetheinyl transferase
MNSIINPIVLIHKIDFALNCESYELLLNSIRNKKREKIERFKFRDDALRSLWGELLIKYGLENYYNIDCKNEIIEEDEFGKPGLKGKKIWFNISHSGDWSVAAFYNDRIGIDVEKLENPPFEIMEKNFTKIEIEQVAGANFKIMNENFYKIWTLKESFIKMLGKGLSVPLDSFSIDISKEDSIIILDESQKYGNVIFKLFHLDSQHIMSICLNNFTGQIHPLVITYNHVIG